MSYNKSKLIQIIHIAKQQLAIDEYAYRLILERLTGKTSCKLLTIDELKKVLDELKTKGFKVQGKSQSPSTSSAQVNSNIVHKIRAIWIDMAKQGFIRDGSEEALNSFMRKIVNNSRQQRGEKVLVLNVRSLKDKEATMVLERLKKWQRRKNHG